MTVSWLPPALSTGAFTAADLSDAGVPGYRWRSPTLVRPTRGVRELRAGEDVVERARAFARALPDDAAFSHVTAALLWGLPLRGSLQADPLLHVIRDSTSGWVRRTDCRGHRGLESRQVGTVHGLRVVSLADTWVDLGELPRGAIGLDDFVVVGDAVAARLASPDEGSDEWWARIAAEEADDRLGERDDARGIRLMRRALERRVRPRGALALRQSLDLVRGRSRSPQETRWRLIMERAGLPEPRLNEPVFVDGGFVLEGDFVWPQDKVIGEYQGKDHASITRRSHDESRRALAEDDGWTLIEVYAEDVRPGPRQDACLRRFATALGRPTR